MVIFTVYIVTSVSIGSNFQTNFYTQIMFKIVQIYEISMFWSLNYILSMK